MGIFPLDVWFGLFKSGEWLHLPAAQRDKFWEKGSFWKLFKLLNVFKQAVTHQPVVMQAPSSFLTSGSTRLTTKQLTLENPHHLAFVTMSPLWKALTLFPHLISLTTCPSRLNSNLTYWTLTRACSSFIYECMQTQALEGWVYCRGWHTIQQLSHLGNSISLSLNFLNYKPQSAIIGTKKLVQE